MATFAWEGREEDVLRVLESRKGRKETMVTQEFLGARMRVDAQKDRLRSAVLRYRGGEQEVAARAVIEDILIEHGVLDGPKQFTMPEAVSKEKQTPVG